MPMTFAAVEAILADLPDVTIGARWGNRTWFVNERGFAWRRPLSKADIARWGDDAPLPTGDILAVITDDLDAKEALLAIAPPGFFTIQHFASYPAILIELRKARAKDVRAAILDAHRAAVAAGPPKARRPRKPRKKKAT